MVRTYSSNKTNGADRGGASGARPTAMERNTTVIKPTYDRVILAVSDTTNTNDTLDNNALPNKQKQN